MGWLHRAADQRLQPLTDQPTGPFGRFHIPQGMKDPMPKIRQECLRLVSPFPTPERCVERVQ